jgi:hypothetical protein
MKWECFGASCYYMPYVKILKTKPDADALCAGIDTHVLAIESVEEGLFINKLLYHSRRKHITNTDLVLFIFLLALDKVVKATSND